MSGHAPAGTERDFTLDQWRRHRCISVTTYYKLKRLGLAPSTINPPGTSLIRITRAADLAWEEKMLTLSESRTAQREAERRTELARRAGQAAAASPAHVSRRKART